MKRCHHRETESIPRQRQHFGILLQVAMVIHGRSENAYSVGHLRAEALPGSIAQPGVIRVESQFAMCRNNSCAPPIRNFANVHVSRLERGGNFLTRDRLLNLSNKLLRSHSKVIGKGNDSIFIYIYIFHASRVIGSKRAGYDRVHAFWYFAKRRNGRTEDNKQKFQEQTGNFSIYPVT